VRGQTQKPQRQTNVDNAAHCDSSFKVEEQKFSLTSRECSRFPSERKRKNSQNKSQGGWVVKNNNMLIALLEGSIGT
jgi:hypothetical protein